MKDKIIVFDFSGTLVKMRSPKLLISKPILNSLDKNFQLGILTGGPRAETLNILKKIGLDQIFKLSLIITKTDSIFKKPNPQLLFSLISKSKAKQAIYIGDKVKDYQMANQANIPFIYIGKRKMGNLQLNYDYNQVEKAIYKLL